MSLFRNSQLLFIFIMITSFFLFDISTVTNSQGVSDNFVDFQPSTISDTIGDVNITFVDIVNATITSIDSEIRFEVFVLENIPIDDFDSSIVYLILFHISVEGVGNDLFLWIERQTSSYHFWSTKMESSSENIWAGSVSHDVNHIAVSVPVTVFRNRDRNINSFLWSISVTYEKWDDNNRIELVEDKCPEGGSGTLRIQPYQDVTISTFYPDSSSTNLRVYKYSDGSDYGLVKFLLPHENWINSHMVLLYTTVFTVEFCWYGSNLRVHDCKDINWDESTVSWDSFHSEIARRGFNPFDDISGDESSMNNGIIEFGVGVEVKSAIQEGRKYLNIALVGVDIGDGVDMYSRESETDNCPNLILEWMDPYVKPEFILQVSTTISTISSSSTEPYTSNMYNSSGFQIIPLMIILSIQVTLNRTIKKREE